MKHQQRVLRHQRRLQDVYAPRGSDAVTPKSRAWAAFRRLVGLEPRLENETHQSLRDAIRAEGEDPYQLGLQIATIRGDKYGGPAWLREHARLLRDPGDHLPRERQPGEDG